MRWPDLHPANAYPNQILYSDYSRYISLVAHFLSVWLQIYFVIAALVTRNYILVVFPGFCLIAYGFLYFGVLGQYKYFIIPAILSDIVSIIGFSIQIYLFKDLPEDDSHGTVSKVAMYTSPIAIFLKILVSPVLVRSYFLIQSPAHGVPIGKEFLTVFLLMHFGFIAGYFIYSYASDGSNSCSCGKCKKKDEAGRNVT
ncbi:unnamed protein product [Bursaphelenchus xylophilus]|uniref:(pine wood nematode) hypothetical protein n=1 Tax=Bursaphelenchus xylophilus TaxID=6326 RepID=A0A1I7S548_BURXY|nr:unnamed protein product [Bursaphelenchus xylophilus]CAG9117700.1 unnamed protein product [Bursaphelenchus xylophilus]